MEWNGMEWNGMEWNGMEYTGMEWNGNLMEIEWDGQAVKRGIERRLKWTGMLSLKNI